MDQLIATFHIDWKLLIAQLINFAVVFFVLWRFALKPVMRVMKERSQTIEKSLTEAAEIEQKLAKTNEEVKEQIRSAKHQATALIEQGKKQAEEKRSEMVVNAKREVEKIIAAAKIQIQEEKESAMKEARAELAHLVALGVGKMLGQSVTEKVDHEVRKNRLQKMK